MQGSKNRHRKPEKPATPRRKLTDTEKRKVFDIVAARMSPDDREPQDVIRTRYGGNTTRWLHDMIRVHEIEL